MQLLCALRLRKSPRAYAIGHVAAQEHEREEPLHLVDRGWHLALRMHEQPHGLRRWFAQHEIRSQPERTVDHRRAVDDPFTVVFRDLLRGCLPSGAMPLSGERIAQTERVENGGRVVAHRSTLPAA